MPMWNTAIKIETIPKQTLEAFKFVYRAHKQVLGWQTRRVCTRTLIIVSLAFVNVMDRIITTVVLHFLHLDLFVLIFDKLFSSEPLLRHLY